MEILNINILPSLIVTTPNNGSWMDLTMPAIVSIVKVTKRKSGLFEHAISMSKQLAGSVYIGNVQYYPMYFLGPFPRGLEIHLEGISTFLTLILSLLHQYIRLILSLIVVFTYLFTMWQGSWTGAAAPCMEVKWHYNVAVSACHSMRQLPKYYFGVARTSYMHLCCIYS